jgi:hypothetical protein
MSNTLPLLGGKISLDQALDSDDNVLAQTLYPQQRKEFFDFLTARKADIEAIVAFNLRVKKCRASDIKTWFSGSYNVCIPVYINPPSKVRAVLVRIPLPYKVGETKYPGNGEEKLRCEIASYLWMQENCPDVPIPTLFGFGFPDGQMVCSKPYKAVF